MKRKNIFIATRRRTSQGLKLNSFSCEIDTFDWASNSFFGANKLSGISTQQEKIGSFSVIKFTWSRCDAPRRILLQLFINLAFHLCTPKEVSSHKNEILSNYLSSHLHAPSFDKTPKKEIVRAFEYSSRVTCFKQQIWHNPCLCYQTRRFDTRKCVVSWVNWIRGKNMFNSRHVLLHLSSTISGHKQRALVCKLFYLEHSSCCLYVRVSENRVIT